jgi:hypothetical protein
MPLTTESHRLTVQTEDAMRSSNPRTLTISSHRGATQSALQSFTGVRLGKTVTAQETYLKRDFEA